MSLTFVSAHPPARRHLAPPIFARMSGAGGPRGAWLRIAGELDIASSPASGNPGYGGSGIPTALPITNRGAMSAAKRRPVIRLCDAESLVIDR